MSSFSNINFINALESDKFVTLVNWQAEKYFSDCKNFSLACLRFEVKKNSSLVLSRTKVERTLAGLVNASISKDKEIFTYDGNSLLFMFADRYKSYAYKKLASIVKGLFAKFPTEITVHIGVAECPENGVNYVDLIDTAYSQQKTFDGQSSELYGVSDPEIDWQSQVSNSLEEIESNIKSQIFAQLNSLIKIIHNYDSYLGDHSALVAQGVILLSKELGLPWKEIEKVSIAALLHDIGYTAIPKEIFNKKGKLTSEERKLVQLHPIIACEHILSKISIFEEYLPMIQNHHEFLDGSGYPRRKRGEQIPLGAQIISIVDTYQAMKSDRPHRKAMNFSEIADYFIKNAGIKWDENLITIFTAIIADEELKEKLNEKDNLTLSLVMKNLE